MKTTIMDQSLQTLYDRTCMESSQQQPQGFELNANSSCIDNVDISSMIGEFMQNEQYPYNLNFNDSLTELSPEETEQFLEDAFSLSSKSPLSDDLTESSISLQNSPGEQNTGEDYLYYTTLSDDIKQEELSPTNMPEYQFENMSQTPLVPVSIQTANGMNKSTPDMQSIMQQNLVAPNPTQDISSLLHQAEDLPVSAISCSRKNPHQFSHINGKGDQFPTIAESLGSRKKTHSDQPNGPLAQLLQTNVSSQLNDYAGKQKCEVRKKSSRIKRQKSESKGQLQENSIECRIEAKSPKLESSEDTKDAIKQQPASHTVSQVVMIPQVVIANGVSDTNTQPITAILATSTKQVMTTVPLKILSSSSSELEKIPINPIGKKAQDASNKKKVEKCGRKTSHNEVEKRYRESITTSLEDLKELVFGSDTKSTKAGILRKAMEHIKYLRKINQRLKQENMRLKLAQKQTSLADLVQSHSAIQNIQHSTIEDFGDSLSSDEEEMEFIDQEIQSKNMNEHPNSNAKHPNGVESVQGNGAFSLVTKQRFFLSMFMFAFMFLGPGNLLFGAKSTSPGDYITPHMGGRTILSYESDAQEDRFKGYMGVIVNCVIYMLFFAWLLIKGEPRFSAESKNVVAFKMYMEKADAELKKGDVESSIFNIERGLNVIGRPWSSSMMDVMPSLLWHSLCHILHQLGLLSLIKSFGWIMLPRRLSLADSKARYHSSCTMAAIAYSKLLQLSIMDASNRRSRFVYAKLALAAINMAESANDAIGLEETLKIYLNVVIMLRLKFGAYVKIMMKYLLSRAKTLLSYHADGMPDSFAWVFHPIGHDYLLSGSWMVDASLKNEGPLPYVRHSFFMTQVKASLRHLIVPADGDLDIKESKKQLSLLQQCCFGNDKTFRWWHDLLSTVFYIGIEMNAKARSVWETISDRNDVDTPFATDLYDLVDCYFDSKDGADKAEIEARLSMVESNIFESFLFDEGKSKHDELLQLMAVCCAEMALAVRITSWETSSQKNISADQLEKFEQDLNILREFNGENACLQAKIQYFEEILRVLVGANPISLRKRLLKSRHGAMDSGTTGSGGKMKNNVFQEVRILLFKLKHLPSIITNGHSKRRISQLQAAGQALEKSGLKEMTEECKKILAIIKTM